MCVLWDERRGGLGYTLTMRCELRYGLALSIALLCAACSAPVTQPPKDYPPGPRIGPLHQVVYAGDGALEGHTWQIDSVNFTFQAGNHVLLRGGPLTVDMPTGAPGIYALEGESFSMEVLDRMYRGRWDGEVLIVNGKEAQYLGRAAIIYPELVLDYPEPPQEVSDEEIDP